MILLLARKFYLNFKFLTEMILNFMNNYPMKILNQTNKNVRMFLYKFKKLIIIPY